jgi:hypothetical protein
MISALQVDLRLLFDAVVDNRIEPVALADWRNGTSHLEKLFDFMLCCQVHVQAELHSKDL